MNDPNFGWRLGFGVVIMLFCAVMCGLGLWTVLRHERRLKLDRQQRAQDERRALMERETMPSMLTLPTVIPAYAFDASDSSENDVVYCPVCALQALTEHELVDIDGFFPMPNGVRQWCVAHAPTWDMRKTEEINA